MKELLRKLTHRRFKSAEDFFSKRTSFGEINEFLRWHAISSDTQEYTLPFLSNPFRAKQEKETWSYRPALEYEYTEDHRDWEQAHDRFNLAYEFLKDRISPDCKIFDVGCATAWQPARMAISVSISTADCLRAAQQIFAAPGLVLP